MLHDGDGQVGSIVYKSRNVILRHLRQLFLEDTLQPSENNEAVVGAIIVDYSELDIATTFFEYSGLCIVSHYP